MFLNFRCAILSGSMTTCPTVHGAFGPAASSSLQGRAWHQKDHRVWRPLPLQRFSAGASMAAERPSRLAATAIQLKMRKMVCSCSSACSLFLNFLSAAPVAACTLTLLSGRLLATRPPIEPGTLARASSGFPGLSGARVFLGKDDGFSCLHVPGRLQWNWCKHPALHFNLQLRATEWTASMPTGGCHHRAALRVSQCMGPSWCLKMSRWIAAFLAVPNSMHPTTPALRVSSPWGHPS